MLRSSDDQAAALERTAEYLADLPRAWEKATPEQRNELAQVLLSKIVINDKRVEAVKPQPNFAPFVQLDYFERLKVLSGGSDGDRSALMNPLVPRFLALRSPAPPSQHGARRRARAARSTRARAAQEQIRAQYAAGMSLRALAAQHQVSHETIRSIVRQHDAPNP